MFLNKQKIFLLEERIILIDSGLDVGFVDILDHFKEAFVFVVSLDTWIVDVGCSGEVFILSPK